MITNATEVGGIHCRVKPDYVFKGIPLIIDGRPKSFGMFQRINYRIQRGKFEVLLKDGKWAEADKSDFIFNS